MFRKQVGLLAAVCVTLVVLASGCTTGARPNGNGERPPTVNNNVLSVGSDLTYPPYASLENGKPVGFDIELTQAIAQQMGLGSKIIDTRFEQLIPGVNGGQFDVIASDLYITPARAQAVRYIPYFTSGSSLIVSKASGGRPANPDDLCGKTVGIIGGAAAVPTLQNEVSNRCRERGQPAVDVRVFPTDPEATQALRAGNVEVQLSDSGVAKHIVDSSGGELLISSRDLLYPVPAGLAVARGNDKLATAIEKALDELRQSGDYNRLLERYNLQPPDPALVGQALGQSNGAGAQAKPAFDWSYLASLFVDHDFWFASLTVIELSVLAWLIAAAFGLLLAIARQSGRRWLSVPGAAYVWLFRSLPLLVLIILVYNVPQVVSGLRPLLSNVFIAGLLALVLSESAYMSEIHRGGLLAIGTEQYEAGMALGLPRRTIFGRIVLPQAFRVAIPSLGNEFVTIVKLTSLLSVISLAEILLVAQRLYTTNFKVLETLVAAAVFYVAIVTVFDQGRAWLEKRLDVKRRDSRPLTPNGSSPGTLTAGIARRARPRQPHSGEVVVRARGLRKKLDQTVILDGVDLQVHRGEVIAIVGPSGSGKTTLLRSLNQLERVDSGTCEVEQRQDGDTIVSRRKSQWRRSETVELRRRVGMVFQRFNLFPHMTALGNVILAPICTGRTTKQEAVSAGRELLEKVGLIDHAEKYPYQLSGGQQQRVAIARALAMRPRVILFDEPTSALDPELVGEVLRVIADLATEGRTMVIVTHEMRFARDVADWVVFLDQGRILEQGPPEQVLVDPQHERTQRFLTQVHAPVPTVKD